MKILFIARYFPSYFRSVAEQLALHGHSVIFVAEQCNKELLADNIQYKIVNFSAINSKAQDRQQLMQLRRVQAFKLALLQLKNEDYHPDLICIDFVGGCIFSPKEIYTDTPFITHIEAFSTTQDVSTMLIPNIIKHSAQSLVRFQFQKDSYPLELQDKITVAHEGIDTDLFTPSKLNFPEESEQANWEILTIDLKGIDAGLVDDSFFAVIQKLFTLRPLCNLVIIGRHKTINSDQLIKQDIFDKAPQAKDFFVNYASRIHFAKTDTMNAYIAMLRTSLLHLYPHRASSIPFGLFEAMSCACTIVSKDQEPLNKILTNNKNAYLFNFNDLDKTAEKLQQIIKHPEQNKDIAKAARELVCKKYSLKNTEQKFSKLYKHIK